MKWAISALIAVFTIGFGFVSSEVIARCRCDGCGCSGKSKHQAKRAAKRGYGSYQYNYQYQPNQVSPPSMYPDSVNEYGASADTNNDGWICDGKRCWRQKTITRQFTVPQAPLRQAPIIRNEAPLRERTAPLTPKTALPPAPQRPQVETKTDETSYQIDGTQQSDTEEAPASVKFNTSGAMLHTEKVITDSPNRIETSLLDPFRAVKFR